MLDTNTILNEVRRALEEDIRSGDVSAALLPDGLEVIATLITREPMLLAGLPWVNMTFQEVDPSINIEWLVAEGTWVAQPQALCRVSGKAKSILTAERTALNFLQTLSGTATQTYHMVKQLKGMKTQLLDTRKTIPGLRYAQKYAVKCAGGMNHRMGLYDAYLIKENHIRALGSLTNAIHRARAKGDGLMVEVEVEDLTQLQEALLAKPCRILLDNFSLALLKKAVKMNAAYGCELEASGGVNIETIRLIAKTGVDFISVGELTKSIRAIDLSLLVEEKHAN
ncbi:MAG: carboxylating nicotinate-nucleotide diphosphorylase [Gammaproteobacteria bacterium]|nr:carboxylating nicotinate-nucleotide diphosphorylase [Gammaproteobacteria bacterium]